MKIIIGSDHAGFNTKEKLKKYLKRKKIEYLDIGTNSTKSVDYPDYAKKVGKIVANDKSKKAKGILICGSGTGMVIAANKIRGIRAVIAYDNYSAKMSRIDNNTNILCLRGRFFPYLKNQKIVSIWLKTKFSGKTRHKRRVKKLAQIK